MQNKIINIKNPSAELLLAITLVAKEKGFGINSNLSADNILSHWTGMQSLTLSEPKLISWYGGPQPGAEEIETVTQFLALIDLKEEVKLNTNYNAIVSKDGVKVGCQKFSFEAIEKLYQAVQKVKRL